MRTSTPCSARIGLRASLLGLWLAGCGLSDGAGSAATGQALAEAPTAGTITLNDSSLPMQTRTSPTGADGSFSVKVAGLLTPYLLRVAWTDADGSRLRYGVAVANQNVDVNGITDLAYGAACAGQVEEQVFWDSDASQKVATADRVQAHLDTLGAVLAPLFARYGVTDPRADRDAVRLLMLDVRVARADDVVVITNRATGGIVFQGDLAALAAGTFHLEHMPARPGATCEAFTYAAYAPCRPDGTQVRAVLSSLPAGCTGGAPVTTQACVHVPPGVTCTAFNYSAYGACQPDGLQVRTVLDVSPAGCTGGAPVTVRTCVYVPPLDGAALYTQYCAGCHGNRKKGETVRSIERAIDRDTGGMGALRSLTRAQLEAISASR